MEVELANQEDKRCVREEKKSGGRKENERHLKKESDV